VQLAHQALFRSLAPSPQCGTCVNGVSLAASLI
jgi:hypothetical protein